MNFEALYQKYKDGSATEEERAFVEGEIEKARRVSALIDEETPVLNETEAETVKKAKRAFNLRSTIRTVIITLSCIAVLAILTFGVIFGTGYISASNNVLISQENALAAAKALLFDITGVKENEQILKESDRELELGGGLTDSIFVYEIEIICGDFAYQVEVSSKSGFAVLTDKQSLQHNEHFEMHEKNRNK